MTNVLPQEDRVRMWVYYRTRFIKAGSTALVSLALLSLVSIAPSYILLIVNKPLVKGADGPSVGNGADHKKDVQKAHALIGDLSPVFGTASSSIQLIEKTLAMRPEGILVNRISYRFSDVETTLVLDGTTSERGQVETLRRVFEDSGLFASVVIPVSDLIGAGGNQFTVTLKMKTL